MTSLVASQPQNPTLPPSVERSIASMRWENERAILPVELTAEDRAWIADRVKRLRAYLAAGSVDRRRHAETVAMLFATLASDKLTDSLAEARAVAYIDALSAEPAWAVEAAARDWIGGRGLEPGENAAFVPKPAQLLRLVAAAKAGAWKQAADLQALLTARVEAPVRPGGKATLDQLKAKFGDDWGIKSAPRGSDAADAEKARLAQRTAEMEQRRFERDCEVAGVDPHPADGTIPVSPALLDRLAEMSGNEREKDAEAS